MLVMKSGAVEKDVALKTKGILESTNVKLLGFVLNQKTASIIMELNLNFK